VAVSQTSAPEILLNGNVRQIPIIQEECGKVPVNIESRSAALLNN
jgi:hypothetical protein